MRTEVILAYNLRSHATKINSHLFLLESCFCGNWWKRELKLRKSHSWHWRQQRCGRRRCCVLFELVWNQRWNAHWARRCMSCHKIAKMTLWKWLEFSGEISLVKPATFLRWRTTSGSWSPSPQTCHHQRRIPFFRLAECEDTKPKPLKCREMACRDMRSHSCGACAPTRASVAISWSHCGLMDQHWQTPRLMGPIPNFRSMTRGYTPDEREIVRDWSLPRLTALHIVRPRLCEIHTLRYTAHSSCVLCWSTMGLQHSSPANDSAFLLDSWESGIFALNPPFWWNGRLKTFGPILVLPTTRISSLNFDSWCQTWNEYLWV